MRTGRYAAWDACAAGNPLRLSGVTALYATCDDATELLHRMFFLFCLKKGRAGFVHNRAILRDKFCPYSFNMLAYLEK